VGRGGPNGPSSLPRLTASVLGLKSPLPSARRPVERASSKWPAAGAGRVLRLYFLQIVVGLGCSQACGCCGQACAGCGQGVCNAQRCASPVHGLCTGVAVGDMSTARVATSGRRDTTIRTCAKQFAIRMCTDVVLSTKDEKNATFEANQPQVPVAWRTGRNHVVLLVDSGLCARRMAIASVVAVNGSAAR
jgi:hypothetical protein